MNELRPHGRELLVQARRERSPTDADRERIFAALMTSPELAAIRNETALAGKKPLGRLARWLLLAGLAAVVAAGVYLASQGSAPHAKPDRSASDARD